MLIQVKLQICPTHGSQRMRTSWRKREAAGATWEEEEATREDEETEPTLDVERGGEAGAGAKRGKGREDPSQPSMKEFIPDPRARLAARGWS